MTCLCSSCYPGMKKIKKKPTIRRHLNEDCKKLQDAKAQLAAGALTMGPWIEHLIMCINANEKALQCSDEDNSDMEVNFDNEAPSEMPATFDADIMGTEADLSHSPHSGGPNTSVAPTRLLDETNPAVIETTSPSQSPLPFPNYDVVDENSDHEHSSDDEDSADDEDSEDFVSQSWWLDPPNTSDLLVDGSDDGIGENGDMDDGEGESSSYSSTVGCGTAGIEQVGGLDDSDVATRASGTNPSQAPVEDSDSDAATQVPGINQAVVEDSDSDLLPPSVIGMRNELLSSMPANHPGPKPTTPPSLHRLSKFEALSLKHFAAWVRSNGTVEAYREHAAVLAEASGVPLLSLHRVKQFARKLVDFTPRLVDMCPKACIAYTGQYQSLESCPYQSPKDTSPCNQPRYYTTKSGRQKRPRAQVQILPIGATIRALFANAETARLLRHRDEMLQKTLRLLKNASTQHLATYSEFADSQIHVEHHNAGLFQNPSDMAFAISTDGAQLTMKKQSNTWFLILIILDLPGDLRYKGDFVIVNFATPGPNSPGDIESFIYPLLEEAAIGSEGTWIWSAIESDHLFMRWYVALALGDMLGSAKMNGMVGHTGYMGDRFSLTPGMKSGGMGKPQYFPMLATSFPAACNPGSRQDYRIPADVPMRRQDMYWDVIRFLADPSVSAQDKADKMRSTGISRLPYCAASRCFIHPTFFPLDPFHLFYENYMPYLWDLWTSKGIQGEIFRLSVETACIFGAAIPAAMCTLPAAFCGPIRDVHLKRNSQYKAFEWMALLHWYIIPLAVEYGDRFHPSVLSNFAKFVQAVEFAMTIKPRTDDDIAKLWELISIFLVDYQRLYIKDDPSKLSRARLCLFQLIHVPVHIQWYGSIRIGSQATVERMIGELGHKIRSKKSPFAHLTSIIYQRELLKILSLYYPELKSKPRQRSSTSANTADANFDSDLNGVPGVFSLRQQHRIAFTKITQDSQVDRELTALSAFLNIPLDFLLGGLQHVPGSSASLDGSSDTTACTVPVIRRWGKLRLPNGRVLGSRLSKSVRTDTSGTRRGHEWFEATQAPTSGETSTLPETTMPQLKHAVFGEAWAFYHVKLPPSAATGGQPVSRAIVLYTPLEQVEQVFHIPAGRFSQDPTPRAMNLSHIQDITGIFTGPNTKKVYILRKHPALEALNFVCREVDPSLQNDGLNDDGSDSAVGATYEEYTVY